MTEYTATGYNKDGAVLWTVPLSDIQTHFESTRDLFAAAHKIVRSDSLVLKDRSGQREDSPVD